MRLNGPFSAELSRKDERAIFSTSSTPCLAQTFYKLINPLGVSNPFTHRRLIPLGLATPTRGGEGVVIAALRRGGDSVTGGGCKHQ